MNKKGFTLIELLAVIVILAIIALIAVPTILGIIEKSRKGAAESSALGYIDAVEKQIAINEVDQSKEMISDQEYDVAELNGKGISLKGKYPDSGKVTVNKNKVESATLCINNYNVIYANGKAKATTKCDVELIESEKVGYNPPEGSNSKATTVAEALDELGA